MKQENRIENENTIQPKKLLCPKAGYFQDANLLQTKTKKVTQNHH